MMCKYHEVKWFILLYLCIITMSGSDIPKADINNWRNQLQKLTEIKRKSIILAENKGNIGEIMKLSDRGEGVVLDQNRDVCIPNCVPGDVVSYTVNHSNRRTRGELIEIVSKSAKRVSPSCPVASSCGGCQLQHVSYDSQLHFKSDSVLSSFRKMESLRRIKVASVIASSALNSYRNKAQFAIQRIDRKSVYVGLYKAKSHVVVNIAKCDIQHDNVNDVLLLIQRFFSSNPHIDIYNETSLIGGLRHVIIRTAFSSNDTMICFVSANKGSIAQLLPLIDTIKSLTIVKSVLININSDPGDTILNYSPSSTSVLYGSSYIHENIAGINVKISLTSFTQSNPIQTKILYGTVHQLLQLNGTETLYDLYCGIGIIGLYLSPYVNKVVGIENNEDAINDARYNMVLNNIENINFICEKAEVFLPTLPIGENETIVINPPRKGCHTSLLHELIRRQVEKLVYISCNPITLARDLDILVSSGIYKIVTVQPIDMFPHTVHVETVVLLHINK